MAKTLPFPNPVAKILPFPNPVAKLSLNLHIPGVFSQKEDAKGLNLFVNPGAELRVTFGERESETL